MAFLPLSILTACGGEEPEAPDNPENPEVPEESPFKPIVGYWMNTDESLAFEIRAGMAISYVRVPTGLETVEGRMSSPFDDFEIGYLSGKELQKMTVEIDSFDEDEIILSKVGSYGGNLSSYTFQRISQEELMEYMDFVVISESGTQAGHGYVDLGLSVKWATANVASYETEPTECGGYYSFGAVSHKDYFSESNSLVEGKSLKQLIREGIVDKNGNLTARYDAATVNWGADWRTPTAEEWNELLSGCYWEWVIVDGKKGLLATGPNGNTIFFRAGGAILDYDQKQFNEGGRYGSASVRESESGSVAWKVFSFFDSDRKPYEMYFVTYAGYSIRAVMK